MSTIEPPGRGNAVEVIGRDQAKAEDLAAALGGDATAGTFGTAPAGDTVILSGAAADGPGPPRRRVQHQPRVNVSG